jgi:hypothetical protein
MSDAPWAQNRFHRLIFGIALFETALYVYLIRTYWFSAHEPATKAFDIAAGLIVSLLFCVTTIPASILALLRAAPRAALLFALAFPVALILTLAVSLALFARI